MMSIDYDRVADLYDTYVPYDFDVPFFCTLHNPRIRLKNADGCLRLNGSYPYEGGRLCLFGVENYDRQAHIVNRMQFYELYDEQGILQSKRCLEMRFCPLDPSELAALQERVGFKTIALYGDYSRSEFKAETSPFAIAILQKLS